MKKFFEDYSVSALLTMVIVCSIPAYYVLPLTYSWLAAGIDPVFVFFAFSIMCCIAALLMVPLMPVFGALVLVLELTGWLVKQLFFAVRYLLKRRRTHNPA